MLGEPATASETGVTEVFGASAAAALYRREMLDEIGGFDESFFAYLEDTDVAWRARMAGWRCVHAPAAVARHHHSATLGHGSPAKHLLVGRNRVRMLAKNATSKHLARYALGMIAYDLAYIAFAGATSRTIAPLQGRASGLSHWLEDRRSNVVRRPTELAKPFGFRGALRRNRSYSFH